IHLYRHPRDQWLTTLGQTRDCSTNTTVANFARSDDYYLLGWAGDLTAHFPMLCPEPDRHPYELFYLIWRLSYLFGRRFADHSLSFESLVLEPRQRMSELFDCVGIVGADLTRLQSLLSPPKLGQWRSYADEAWFLEIEQQCEALLAEFFGHPVSASA